MTYRADSDLFVLRRTAAAAAAAAAGTGAAGTPTAAALLLLFNFGPTAAVHAVEGGRWRAAEVGRDLLPAGCRPCGEDGWVGEGATVEVPLGSALVLESLP
jgi:hypothetical protein